MTSSSLRHYSAESPWRRAVYQSGALKGTGGRGNMWRRWMWIEWKWAKWLMVIVQEEESKAFFFFFAHMRVSTFLCVGARCILSFSTNRHLILPQIFFLNCTLWSKCFFGPMKVDYLCCVTLLLLYCGCAIVHRATRESVAHLLKALKSESLGPSVNPLGAFIQTRFSIVSNGTKWKTPHFLVHSLELKLE